MRISEWRGHVYKTAEPIDEPEDWHETRARVLARYKNKCYRCDKASKRDMSIHHIIARSAGGGDNDENLIPLCNSCHDYVEINELSTKADIQGSYDVEAEEKKHPVVYSVRKEHSTRPDWHKWVYGGLRNPQGGPS